jgi:hypothetical protein
MVRLRFFGAYEYSRTFEFVLIDIFEQVKYLLLSLLCSILYNPRPIIALYSFDEKVFKESE